MSFYVGQKVVALVSDRVLVKGNEYTVMELFYCPKCGHEHIGYSVKAPSNCNGSHCESCWLFTLRKGNYHTRDSNCFAPIEEYGDSMSLAMQLVQELDQVDKAKNPIKKPHEV